MSLLFTIKEKSVGKCQFPFASPNKDVAVRMFTDFLAKGQAMTDTGKAENYFHKDDFLLLAIGSFNEETGELIPIVDSADVVLDGEIESKLYQDIYQFYFSKFSK